MSRSLSILLVVSLAGCERVGAADGDPVAWTGRTAAPIRGNPCSPRFAPRPERDAAPMCPIAPPPGGGPLWLDQFEVSNAQYLAYLTSIGATDRIRRRREDEPDAPLDAPSTGLIWADAVRYCEWAGKRLPSGAELEVAASLDATGEGWTAPSDVSPSGVHDLGDRSGGGTEPTLGIYSIDEWVTECGPAQVLGLQLPDQPVCLGHSYGWHALYIDTVTTGLGLLLDGDPLRNIVSGDLGFRCLLSDPRTDWGDEG